MKNTISSDVLRCVTDAIMDIPSVRGTLSLRDCSELGQIIYNNLIQIGIINENIAKVYVYSDALKRYDNYCNRKSLNPNEALLEFIDERTGTYLYTFHHGVGHYNFIIHKGVRLVIPRVIIRKER